MWMPFTHKMLPSKPSHKEGKQSETGLLKAKHTRPRHTRSRCTAQKKGRKGARRNHTAKKHTTANLALEVCHGLLQQQGAALSKLTDTAVSGGQLAMCKGARPLSSLLNLQKNVKCPQQPASLHKPPWLPKQ